VRHAPVAVLMIAVIAILAGAQNFREIGDEAADLPQEMLARVGARWSLRRRRWVAPSAATIRRVIGEVDAKHLDRVIYQRLRTRSGWDTRAHQQTWLVALDGKTCTGASRPGDEVKLFSALVHGQATVIARIRVPPRPGAMGGRGPRSLGPVGGAMSHPRQRATGCQEPTTPQGHHRPAHP